MSKNDNILTKSTDLKTMPYSIPEGYFESLGGKVLGRIRESGESAAPVRKRTLFSRRFIPYWSAAAAAAIVVALGLTLALAGRQAVIPEDSLEDSDYVFYYAEIIPVTEPESIYYSFNSTSEGLDSEDIIQYLVESGVDVDTMINDLN